MIAADRSLYRAGMTSDPGAEGHAAIPFRGWIADSAPEFRKELLRWARPQAFAAGAVIYQAGETNQSVFGVRSGVVVVQARNTHPDALLLHMLWPGDWFGTFPALRQRQRLFSATARTNVELLYVPGEHLQVMLDRRPEWVAELARDAISGLEAATQGAVDLLIRDASARCAAVLLRLSGQRWPAPQVGAQPVEIPATQGEIAMLCNLSKNTLSRVLNEFSDAGLLRLGYRSITIHDPARMRAIADAG
jgi:CRP-like cAMP-binding protein